jgi:hypothetical protein
VSPVKYELGFYIPEDDILHSRCRENLKSDVLLCCLRIEPLLVVRLIRTTHAPLGNSEYLALTQMVHLITTGLWAVQFNCINDRLAKIAEMI